MQMSKKDIAPENLLKQWKSMFFSHGKKGYRAKNLTVIGNPLKTLENQRLRPPGRQVPGSEAMRPPAARPGITMPYNGNHWEIIGFCMFGQIAYGAFRCVPLRRMENLMVIGKPCKSLEKRGFRALTIQNKKQPRYGYLSWQRQIPK